MSGSEQVPLVPFRPGRSVRLQADRVSPAKAGLYVTALAVWIAAVYFAASASTSATAQSASSPAQASGSTPAGELVAGYCVSCHNERLKTGNLALDKADAQHVGNSPETWEKVIVKLRSRAMP